jgi:O-antigen/teichoic acid export membrane protein
MVWQSKLALKPLISKVKQSTIARNSFVYTLDFSLQILVQAAYLLLLSRALGPANFGIFAGLSAISIIGSTFVGWGCDQVLIKNVAANRGAFAVNFGNGLIGIGISLPVLFVVCYLISAAMVKADSVSPVAICAIMLADLLFTKVLFLAKACFAAIERSKPQLVINIVTTLIKLVAAVLAVLVSPKLTAEQWGWWYCGSAAVAATFAVVMVLRQIEAPTFKFLPGEFKVGALFCIEFASLAALRDADKPIIVSVLGPEVAGYYSVAFRVVDAASTPVRGLLYATYTRYFRHAHEGTERGVQFGLNVLPYAAGFSAVVSLLLLVCSGLIPWLLGAKYEPAVNLIRWMALYPMLYALTGVSADILRAIGMQRTRIAILILAIPALIGVCWLGGHWAGSTGAAIGRMVVMAMVVVLSWWLVLRFKRSL